MRSVILCTKGRGVFYGDTDATKPGRVLLTDARICVYWEGAKLGVLGLAEDGPSKQCRVSDTVSAADIRGVTAILEVTPQAKARWDAGPWGQ